MDLYIVSYISLFFVAMGVFTLFGVQFKREASVKNRLINFLLGFVGLGLIMAGVFFFISQP